MSGGSAETKVVTKPASSAASGAGAASSAADDASLDSRMDQAKASLMWGFLGLLNRAFPERWNMEEDGPVLTMKQIMADVTYVSGYKLDMLCIDVPEAYKHSKPAFEAFAKKHKMKEPGCICFHGSNFLSVTAIHDHGFDLERCKEGRFGNGAYVSPHLMHALVYAEPDIDDTLWTVFGYAHLGHPAQIPVGSQGQTDFGVRADGMPNMTLRDPEQTYFCLRDAHAFLSHGFMGFKLVEKPSDFALLHMTYAPKVWQSMQQRIPGLVAYKQSLIAKEKRRIRKARRQAAWAAAVGSREQPSRSVKRKR